MSGRQYIKIADRRTFELKIFVRTAELIWLIEVACKPDEVLFTNGGVLESSVTLALNGGTKFFRLKGDLLLKFRDISLKFKVLLPRVKSIFDEG